MNNGYTLNQGVTIMTRKANFFKFSIAFIIAYLIPIFWIHLISGSYPSSISLVKLLATTSFSAVIASLIAMLLSKKGQPVSIVLFTLCTVALEGLLFMKIYGTN
jgi:hypothetical protein